jgi:hypothetical protein
MRLVQQQVSLQADAIGKPLALRHDGELHTITHVIDTWQWAGNWVADISERTYWLAGSDRGTVFELYRESTGQWWISAIQD